MFSEIVIAAGLPVRVALGLVVIAARSQVHGLSPFGTPEGLPLDRHATLNRGIGDHSNLPTGRDARGRRAAERWRSESFLHKARTFPGSRRLRRKPTARR